MVSLYSFNTKWKCYNDTPKIFLKYRKAMKNSLNQTTTIQQAQYF